MLPTWPKLTRTKLTQHIANFKLESQMGLRLGHTHTPKGLDWLEKFNAKMYVICKHLSFSQVFFVFLGTPTKELGTL